MQQKTIWTLFLLIGISLFVNSCGKHVDYLHTITYVYKNGTSHHLVLEVYDRNGVNFKNFQIAPNEAVETGTTIEEAAVPFKFYNPANYGDSVVIRFSNNRCLSYKRLSNGFGPKIFDYRKYDNYTPGLFEQNKPITYTLYYTITVADNNESVVCE